MSNYLEKAIGPFKLHCLLNLGILLTHDVLERTIKHPCVHIRLGKMIDNEHVVLRGF